ncbi:MAG: c-type cytochrome [Alphaproteobacteria bacterium]
MRRIATVLAAGALLAMGATGLALAGGTHAGGHGTTGAEEGHAESAAMMPHDLDEMREMHREHQHGHDFAVMEQMTADQQSRVLALLQDTGVVMPPMDAERGRHLFVEKGCIACHSVGGVGGDLGPALNAGDMPRPMNSFEFAARMWRGARAMTEMQEYLLGEVVSLDGQDLADLVVFAHDAEEQAKLTEDQIPERYRNLIEGE